jgi:hypothetical protein
VFWHWGDNGDYQAFAMGFPRQRTGMVCMANSKNGRALWPELFGFVFGSEPEGGAPTVPPAVSWLLGLYSRG